MSAYSKRISLPEVGTPGVKSQLIVGASKHTVKLRRRLVPPLLSLAQADLTPYMQCRSLKNSPRGKNLIPSHRKTSSVLSLGNSPTATSRARAETPEAGVTSATPSRFPNPATLPKQLDFQPFRGKLEHFRQAFDQIIEQNSSWAFVLEEIRAGYEDVIRQAGLETLRVVGKSREDSVEAHLCENLIDENRHLTKQAAVLRKQLNSLLRENEELRRNSQAKATPSGPQSPTAVPRPVPKLDLKSVPSAGFQDEFMALADVFSQSWRDAIKGGR